MYLEVPEHFLFLFLKDQIIHFINSLSKGKKEKLLLFLKYYFPYFHFFKYCCQFISVQMQARFQLIPILIKTIKNLDLL